MISQLGFSTGPLEVGKDKLVESGGGNTAMEIRDSAGAD